MVVVVVVVAADGLGFGFGIWIMFGCFEFCLSLGLTLDGGWC